MGAIEHLTVTLSAEAADKVRARVASGDYLDASAVIEEALASLETFDRQIEAVLPEIDESEVERWIRSEVVPALARYDEDPSRGLTIDQVRDRLAQARAERERARC